MTNKKLAKAIPLFSETVEWRQEKFRVDVFDSNDFKDLKDIKQVYGFIFDNNGEILLVRSPGNKDWSLPGGTPEEYDSNWKETLKRELLEEADVEIFDILPCCYIQNRCLDENKNGAKEGIMLRAVAFVRSIKDQTIDPAHGKINERKFIKPEDFIKFTKWGENGKVQLRLALERIKEVQKNSEIIEIIEPSEKIFKMSDKMQKRIKKILPNSKTRLIGSFAIPVCGKKEIDILIEVDNVEEASNLLEKEGFKKGLKVKNEIFFSYFEEEIQYDLHVLPQGDNHIRKVYDKVIDYFKKNEDKRIEFDNFKRSLNGLSPEEYKKRKGEYLERTVFADWLRGEKE